LRTVLIVLVLVPLISFSYDLYVTAMNAYNVGDYARALELFERLLKENPRVEELDPYVKLKMGICAYAIGDMSKARVYLSLFPENVVGEELLGRLQVGEEEWRRYLKPVQTSPAPTPKQEQKRIPLFFSVLVSSFAFLGTFLLMRLVVGRGATKTPTSHRPRMEVREVEPPKEPPSPVVESFQPVASSELESQIRVIEELLGKISKEEKEEEALVVEEEDLLKKASILLETTEEVPEDLTASELNLDPSAVFEELDGKEEYTEEDTKKLVKALKVMLREGK